MKQVPCPHCGGLIPLYRLVVNGLRSAVNDHGTIARANIGSAAKRVVGQWKAWRNDLNSNPHAQNRHSSATSD